MINFKQKRLNNYIIILIAIFIFNFGYSTLIPVLPIYFKFKGFSPIMIGFLFSLYAIVKSLTHLPSVFIINKIKRSIVLEITFLLIGILLLLYPCTSNYTIFNFFRFIEGAIAGIIFTTTYSLLSCNIQDNNKSGKYLGYFTTVASLGLALGPLLTGVLMKLKFKYETIFFIAAILIFFSSFFLYVFYNSKNEYLTQKSENNKVINLAFLNWVRINFMSILSISTIAFIGDFIFSSLTMLIPMIFNNIYSNVPEYSSFLFSINFFVFTFFSPIAGLIVDKYGIKLNLNLSLLIIAFLFWLITVVNSLPIFLLLMFCEFLFASLLYTTNQVNAIKIGNLTNKSSTIFALVGTFQSIGFSTAPIIIGYTYDINSKYSFLVLSIVVAFVLIVNIPYSLFLIKK